MAKCLGCGHEFEPVKPARGCTPRYCSVRCRTWAQNQRSKGKPYKVAAEARRVRSQEPGYRVAYARDAEIRHRHKDALIAYLGGGCRICGDTRSPVLQFHHRDPDTKAFNISTHLKRSLAVLKAEADKCDLLCANCHLIHHAEGRQP